MTRPKMGRSPVSSFGPELMALLIKASRERVEVPCESMAQMKHLQMRIHMLRGAMNKERHPQYALATRVHTSCTWDHEAFPSRKGRQFPPDATGCKLVLYPKDSQFASILANAGITVTSVAADVLDEVAIPDTPPDPSIQSAEPEASPDSTANPYERFK